jgi:hypothetical protein
MRWNSHSELRGRHAFLSPSNYHWVNYTPQKLEARFQSYRGAARGTALHDLAKNCIDLGVRLDESEKALAWYVADAIDLGLSAEQYLYYSENCFGQSDAIGVAGDILHVHDLKTGVGPVAKFTQLEVYAALYCLEYIVDPFALGFELRIYQGEEIRGHQPHSDTILSIMDKIREQDSLTEALKEG